MRIDECKRRTSEKIVKLSDSGKSINFSNPNKDNIDVITVDGCAICEESAADYIIRRDNFDWIVIELKGRDIEQATKQIKETINKYTQSIGKKGKINTRNQ